MAKQKVGNIAAGIVTSDDAAPKLFGKLRVPQKLIKYFALIVTALVVCGLLLLVNHLRPSKVTYQAPPKTAAQRATETTTQIANSYLDNPNHSDQTLQAAQAKLAALAAQAKASDQKQIYVLASANLDAQAGNIDGALAKALAADATFKTSLTAAMVAGIYAEKADNTKAIEYYKIAASRSPKTGPTERSAYNDYTLMARNVGAQQ